MFSGDKQATGNLSLFGTNRDKPALMDKRDVGAATVDTFPISRAGEVVASDATFASPVDSDLKPLRPEQVTALKRHGAALVAVRLTRLLAANDTQERSHA